MAGRPANISSAPAVFPEYKSAVASIAASRTSSVLRVVSPVCQVDLCRARDHQLQLPSVEHRHQPHIHHLTSTHTQTAEGTQRLTQDAGDFSFYALVCLSWAVSTDYSLSPPLCHPEPPRLTGPQHSSSSSTDE